MGETREEMDAFASPSHTPCRCWLLLLLLRYFILTCSPSLLIIACGALPPLSQEHKNKIKKK
jgi:hypothetical protein